LESTRRQSRDIVCVSCNHWSGLPTSKQHLMSVLSRSHRVLYVDPPMDVFSVMGRRRRWGKFRGVTRVSASLVVLSPVVLVHRSSLGDRLVFHRAQVERVLETARCLGFTDTILWTSKPEHVAYAGKLGESVHVYHVADEPEGATGEPGDVTELEQEIVGRADLILAASEALLRGRSDTGRAHRLRNAADARHFRRIISGDAEAETNTFLADLEAPRVIPREYSGVPRPIVLYAGAAYSWFDDELFLEAANLRPSWTFAIVGPPSRRLRKTRKPDNVLALGRRSYEDFPWYVLGADVAVAPLRDCSHTEASEPIILYEYLLCGKPVVATPFPAAREKGALIETARSAGEFVDRIEEQAAARADPSRIRNRVEFALANTWEHRAQSALGHIESVPVEGRGS
jgi:glycosyltransferase involved in cell wall biosynthesis